MLGLFFVSLLAYPFLGFLVRPITIFFHELGHALPALYYDRNASVEIFVGSYGDEDDSFWFKIGRLKIWFCWNLFARGGLCRPEAELTLDQKITVVTCGPVASFVVAVVCITLFVSDYSSTGSLLMGVFLISAIHDLFYNLGREVIIEYDNGARLYSDAYQLRQYRSIKEAQANI